MTELENKRYWIWFSLLLNIGNIKKQKLLNIYKNPEVIYNLKENDLKNIKILKEENRNYILNKRIKNSVNFHIEYMHKNNIDIISNIDKEYPLILKNIYDYPISIYIKGKKEILNKNSIAIVGCRDASNYGEKVAKYFAYNLSKQNVNIVSGLAKGIDSYAHIGNICAINYEKNQIGRAIAVVGNGLDIIYPKENQKLAENILKLNGAIISEYPIGTEPKKMNFPARNRIISGISNAIIVIEAKEKSGTLITVDFALEQGKDIYVVPGNINSINSVGTNELIKQGARLITNYKDIEIK